MAADVKIELDVSDFLRTIDTKLPAFIKASEKAENEIGDEVLRLMKGETLPPKSSGGGKPTTPADTDEAADAGEGLAPVPNPA